MKQILIMIFTTYIGMYKTYGQHNIIRDSSYFIKLNQQIDSYVVEQNVKALDSLYAEDFVFSHGTGLIEGKTSWLNTVKKTSYPMRKHDSVTAQIHPDMTIVKGKMYIRRLDKDRTTGYTLKYIRVYGVRNKTWQLVSHTQLLRNMTNKPYE